MRCDVSARPKEGRDVGVGRHTREEILDAFHINLHVADFDGVLDRLIRRQDRSEDLLDDPGNQTFEFWILNVRALGISISSRNRPPRPTIIAVSLAQAVRG